MALHRTQLSGTVAAAVSYAKMYCCMVGAQIGPGQEKKQNKLGLRRFTLKEHVGTGGRTDGLVNWELGRVEKTIRDGLAQRYTLLYIANLAIFKI